MYISQLSLTNYRNFSRLTLDLPPGPVLLRGDNANGKTNLLESIYFLSTTRSVHARTDQQLINWLVLRQEMLPFARVVATVQTQTESFQLAITIVKEGDSLRKDTRLNGVKKRAMDVIGKLNTVMFLPEDIELVTGAPARITCATCHNPHIDREESHNLRGARGPVAFCSRCHKLAGGY